MRCYIHVCMLHPPGSAYVYTLQGCISHHTLACSLHLMAQASWVLELLSPVGKRRQKGAKIAHLIGFQTQKCKSIQSSTSNCNQKKNMVLSLLSEMAYLMGVNSLFHCFFSLLWWRRKKHWLRSWIQAPHVHLMSAPLSSPEPSG